MKTPWSKLLDHGVAFAAIAVISVAVLGLILIVGIGVLLHKLSNYISI